LLITSTSNFSTNEFIAFFISDCLGSPASQSTYWQIHDNILPKKKHANLGFILVNSKFVVSPKKATANKIESLQDAVLASEKRELLMLTRMQSSKNMKICAFGNMASLAQLHPPKKVSLQTYLPTILPLPNLYVAAL
jgi:hypothetical protein